jgi:hypothetical protein
MICVIELDISKLKILKSSWGTTLSYLHPFSLSKTISISSKILYSNVTFPSPASTLNLTKCHVAYCRDMLNT